MATGGWEAAVRKQVEDLVAAKTIELAHKAADEMVKEYAMIMVKFYAEYTPKFYKRTGGLAGSFQRYYKNSHGGLGIVYGGVEFGSDFMPEVYRAREGASRVMDSFLWGFHGPEFLGIESGIPEPYIELEKRRDYIANNLV